MSSAIQQNVLFMNNKLTVDYQTILNKQALDKNAIDKRLTNAEQLLEELKNRKKFLILHFILKLQIPHY